jgi:hypothetical protein
MQDSVMSELIYRCKTKATNREGDRLRFSVNWVFARRAELRLTTEALECGDWTIPYVEINDAALLAVPTVFGTAHTLKIKSGCKTYLFQLKSTSLWRLETDKFWFEETPLALRTERAQIHWRRKGGASAS